MTPAAREWAHKLAGQFELAFALANEAWHIELAGARGAPKVLPTDAGGPAQPTRMTQSFANPALTPVLIAPEAPVVASELADLFTAPMARPLPAIGSSQSTIDRETRTKGDAWRTRELLRCRYDALPAGGHGTVRDRDDTAPRLPAPPQPVGLRRCATSTGSRRRCFPRRSHVHRVPLFLGGSDRRLRPPAPSFSGRSRHRPVPRRADHMRSGLGRSHGRRPASCFTGLFPAVRRMSG